MDFINFIARNFPSNTIIHVHYHSYFFKFFRNLNELYMQVKQNVCLSDKVGISSDLGAIESE